MLRGQPPFPATAFAKLVSVNISPGFRQDHIPEG